MIKVRPPEGFAFVHLPTKDFEKAAKVLRKLGFDVEVYMEVDFNEHGEKILDTCLDAVRRFDFDDIEASITVSGCISEHAVAVTIDYSTKGEHNAHVAYTDGLTFDEVYRVSELIQNVKSIIEEHMQKIRHGALKIREFRKRVEEILLQRGYTRTDSSLPVYRKSVGKFVIDVLCSESSQTCNVGIGEFGTEELPEVLDKVEKMFDE